MPDCRVVKGKAVMTSFHLQIHHAIRFGGNNCPGLTG